MAQITRPQGVYISTPPILIPGVPNFLNLDSAGSLYVDGEGRKATYRVALGGASLASLAFPFFTLFGSAAKTVKVTSIRISINGTAASQSFYRLEKHTSVFTGGTSGAPATIAKFDSGDSASTATPLAWTAVATGGGILQSLIENTNLICQATTTTANPNSDYSSVYGGESNGAKPIILRGTSEGVGLFFGHAITTQVNGFIEWTEE